ncbi:alpha/beta fold hydrolase [Hyphomicrobium sp. LHD-15]|uniref:alpha/beta hydrolase family protein n=1 Tax=Hyphomicrobium sp. LHD-15 TaxID=3072142 RepID=UPI00280F504A|nr:alpha/beta fold hydrolase [Hyphomicrobium sp. LHD-15]MDQ8697833.1 alpha/beta fold hydrolase [Hyphomicrobium sp. LHD-15]
MLVEHLIFKSEDIPLAGTLTLPSNQWPVPAAILASGSGHHDRDETVSGKKPFKVIAEYLGARGYGVLRFDDRGVGESGGLAEEATFETQIADLIAARDFLMRDDRVASHRIALIGHSEGGLVAAAAANQTNAPVVMLAGPAVALDELLHWQAWRVSSEMGATEQQLAYERRMNTEVFALVRSVEDPENRKRRTQDLIEGYLRSWPGHSWSNREEISEAAAQMASIVAASDYRSLLLQHPQEILSNLKSPVLALFGDLDCQVEAQSNLNAFREATKANPAAEAGIIPGLNHMFQRARTGSIQEYERLGDSPSPEALAYLERWLGQHL